MWHFGGKQNDIVINRALLFFLDAIGKEGWGGGGSLQQVESCFTGEIDGPSSSN